MPSAPKEKHGPAVKGVRRAQNGPRVAGVLDAVQHQVAARLQAGGQGGRGHGAGEDHPLGGLHGADGGHDALADLPHVRAIQVRQGDAGGVQHRADGRAPQAGLPEELGAVAQELPGLLAVGAGGGQLAEMGAQGVGAAGDAFCHGGLLWGGRSARGWCSPVPLIIRASFPVVKSWFRRRTISGGEEGGGGAIRWGGRAVSGRTACPNSPAGRGSFRSPLGRSRTRADPEGRATPGWPTGRPRRDFP